MGSRSRARARAQASQPSAGCGHRPGSRPPRPAIRHVRRGCRCSRSARPGALRPGQLPLSVRIAAIVQLAEAVGMLAAALIAGIDALSGKSYQHASGVAITLIGIATALALAYVARGLNAGRRWSRTPAMLTQLFTGDRRHLPGAGAAARLGHSGHCAGSRRDSARYWRPPASGCSLRGGWESPDNCRERALLASPRSSGPRAAGLASWPAAATRASARCRARWRSGTASCCRRTAAAGSASRAAAAARAAA